MIATFVCYVSVVCFVVTVYVFRHDLRTWGVIFENKVSNLCRIVVVAVATKSVCSHITNPREHQSSGDALKASSFKTAVCCALLLLVSWCLVGLLTLFIASNQNNNNNSNNNNNAQTGNYMLS